MHRRPARASSLVAAVLVLLAGTSAVRSDVPLFEDLPGPEVRLDSVLPAVETASGFPETFSLPDGRIVVLKVEGFQLRAVRSSDGGATWNDDVLVAGAPSSSDVRDYRAVLSDDGILYVALATVDAPGGYGLQFVRSDDLGETWTAPVDLVAPGDPGHGLRGEPILGQCSVAAESGGAFGVAWVSRIDGSARVVTTWDGGEHWIGPAVAVAADPSSDDFADLVDLVLDPASRNVVVATSAYLSSRGVRFVLPWVTRSTDGGATFDEPRKITTWMSTPVIDETLDLSLYRSTAGTILLAFSGYDAWFGGIYVWAMRSDDVGATWTVSLADFQDDWLFLYRWPRFLEVGSSTVLLRYASLNGTYLSRRSTDDGRTFSEGPEITGGIGGYPYEPLRMVRTADGSLVAGWRRDLSPRLVTSTDGGATWSAPASVPAPDVYTGGPWALTATGNDDVFVAVPAQSATNELEAGGIYGSRASAGTLAFPPLAHIDVSHSETRMPGTSDLAVTTDELGRIYVSWRQYRTVTVVASDDRGRTLDPAATWTAPDDLLPLSRLAIAATASDRVDVVYLVSGPYPDYEILVLHSDDRGMTWGERRRALPWRPTQTAATVAADGTICAAYSRDYAVRDLRVACTPDGGETWSEAALDVTDALSVRGPSLCASGDRFVVAWNERRPISPYGTYVITGAYSDDAGVTFSTRTSLSRAETVTADDPALACSSDGALVVWQSRTSGPDPTNRIRSARLFGEAWSAETDVGTVRSFDADPVLTFDDASRVVVTAEDTLYGPERDYGLLAFASVDGGATFLPPVRLDASTPDPAAISGSVVLASDGRGNVFAAWDDLAVGPNASIATTHSSDGGVTWSPVRRADRKTPQGGYPNSSPRIAALPGTGLIVWPGQRDGRWYSLLMQTDALNRPPVADAGGDRVLECTGDLAATAMLDGAGSSDPDSTSGSDDIASYVWTEGTTTLAEGVTASVPLALGSHDVTLTVTDRGGLSDDDTAAIAVADTAAPTGGIVAPEDGACFGPGAVPVEVEAAFADVCDPDLAVAYEPAESVAAHGDHTVRVAATDAAGNAASDAVAFTVDLEPPAVSLTLPPSGVVVPESLPIGIASSDDDGAAGGVVVERLLLDGCVAYDGATYGDGDGLLSDETIDLGLPELCRIAAACGLDALSHPVLRAEAVDCGGNVGAAEVPLGFSATPFPGVCGR